MFRDHERRFADGGGGTVSGVVAQPVGFAVEQSPGIILAHGAGNDMHNPLIGAVHEGLAARGFLAVKFNFPYKERGRRAPDPAPVLERCYQSVVDEVRNDPNLRPTHLFLAGKSLGGRMASHLAASGLPAAGLIFLGYPLHPAGQPDKMRVAHLPRIGVPMLFFAGTRDPLCRLDLLRGTLRSLEGSHALHVIEDGDHSFQVLKRTGRTQQEIFAEIVETAALWMKRVVATGG